ncbi:hypothetical protein J0672_24755, partial [Vibrio parahaemolyticus]|nr:hypothetical protein [Vibrio parahaemolyticus]
GRLTRTLEAQGGWIYSAAFSPNGKTLVSGGLDGRARIWSAEGSLQGSLSSGGGIYALAFAPEGDRFAVGNRDGAVWV